MPSNLVRPEIEEKRFDQLAEILDIPKEELVRCERGLKRFIKQFYLGTANSLGRIEDHLIVVLNDIIIVAENALNKRNAKHAFDIHYNIPLRGLSVNNHPGLILLENEKESIHVVLEGTPTMVHEAFECIRQEANSVNGIDHLPTSVVRPSRDPRFHRQMIVEDTENYNGRSNRRLRISEGPITIEQAREHAAQDAQLRRRRAREMREQQHHPEIQEVTGEDDDIQLVDEIELTTGMAFAPPDEPEVPKPEPVEDELTHLNFAKMVAAEIFGQSTALSILKKHPVNFGGRLPIADEMFQPCNSRFVVLDDFFVYQRLGEKKYEVYLNHEGAAKYDGKNNVEVSWPHGIFIFDLVTVTAASTFNKFAEAFMTAKAIEEAKPENERYQPVVLGNCIVRPGQKSIGRTPPDIAIFERTEEAMREATTLLQCQSSLGTTCDWFLCRKRKFIAQAPMSMYAENGELETRRIILLSDRILIAKPCAFKTHESHTHDIIDCIDVLKCKIAHIGNVIHIRMPFYRRFLIAKDEDQAEDWSIEMQLVIDRAVKHEAMIKARNDALYAAQKEAQLAALFAAQKAELARQQGQPHDVDPNLEQEQPEEETEMLVGEEDDELSNHASSNGSYTGIVSDNEGDTMHDNSPVGQRMTDFDDDEFDDDEDDEDEDFDDGEESNDLLRPDQLDEEFDENDFVEFERQQEQQRLREEEARQAQAALDAVYADLQKKRAEGAVSPPGVAKYRKVAVVESNGEIKEIFKRVPGGSPSIAPLPSLQLPLFPPEGSRSTSPPRGDILVSMPDDVMPSSSSSERAMPSERRLVLGVRPQDPRLTRHRECQDEERDRLAMIAATMERLNQEERIISKKMMNGEGSSKSSSSSMLGPVEQQMPFLPSEHDIPAQRPSTPIPTIDDNLMDCMVQPLDPMPFAKPISLKLEVMKEERVAEETNPTATNNEEERNNREESLEDEEEDKENGVPDDLDGVEMDDDDEEEDSGEDEDDDGTEMYGMGGSNGVPINGTNGTHGTNGIHAINEANGTNGTEATNGTIEANGDHTEVAAHSNEEEAPATNGVTFKTNGNPKFADDAEHSNGAADVPAE